MFAFLIPIPKKHRDRRCQGLLLCQLTKLYQTELPIPPQGVMVSSLDFKLLVRKHSKSQYALLSLRAELRPESQRPESFYMTSFSEMLAWNVNSDLYLGLCSKVRQATVSSTSRVNDVPQTGQVRVPEHCCDLLGQLLTLGAATHCVYGSAGCGPHLLY